MLIKNEQQSSLKQSKETLKNILSGIVKKRNIVAGVCFLLIVLIYVTVTFVLLYDKGDFYTELRNSLKGVKNLPAYVVLLPKQIYRRLTTEPKQLAIEISPRNFQKLMQWRQDSIDNGLVIKEHKQYLKGTIRENGGDPKDIRLRLKGDAAYYHMDTSKWSLRVVMEGEDNIFGMQRFSLQHPQRRSYLRSFIFHKMLELEGVMSINYDLVRVTINGADKGIYNIEEVPSAAMIKRHNREEGVFVRFDEGPHMTEKVDQSAYKDAYLGSAIITIGQREVFNQPRLKEHFLRATELLNGFRHGDLVAHEVFDIQSMARWMAIGDILGCWHGFGLGNKRFYYNPDLDRLQPIGWDGVDENNFGIVGKDPHGDRLFRLDDPYMDPETVFWKEIFDDQILLTEYIRTLDRMTQPEYLDNQLTKIEDDLQEYLPTLQRDYPQFTLERDVRMIKDVQDYIRRVYLYPVKNIHAYFEDYYEKVLTLGFTNRKPIPVEILSVRQRSDNVELIPEGERIMLTGKAPLKPPVYQRVKFQGVSHIDLDSASMNDLEVKYRVLGLEQVRTETIYDWKRYDSAEFKERRHHLKTNLAGLEFLEIDEKSKEIFIKKGTWTLTKTLRVPKGFTLRAEAGTKILLDEAAIVSLSPVVFRGTEEDPIIIEGKSIGNTGLVIKDTDLTSTFEYVQFRNLSKPNFWEWEVNSSVTFENASLNIKDCIFDKSRTDNFVSVINAFFQIDQVVFRDSLKSALSINFSKGYLSDLIVKTTGKHALILTGSQVEVHNMNIDDVKVSGIKLQDSSKLDFASGSIRRCSHAVNVEGLSSALLDSVLIKECDNQPFFVSDDSTLSFNGQNILNTEPVVQAAK